MRSRGIQSSKPATADSTIHVVVKGATKYATKNDLRLS